jgi:hypothetical protein
VRTFLPVVEPQRRKITEVRCRHEALDGSTSCWAHHQKETQSNDTMSWEQASHVDWEGAAYLFFRFVATVEVDLGSIKTGSFFY